METKNCKKCGENPVLIKKWQMCSKCYQRERYADLKGLQTKKTPLQKWIFYHRRLKIRFGDEFIHDLLILKERPMTTLTQFGEKYGVTKEWMRQIFKNYFGYPYTECIKEKANKIKKDFISCKFDPVFKIKNYNGKGYYKQAAVCTLKFINECKKRNFDVSKHPSNSSLVIVNGIIVSVKSCYIPRKTAIRSPVYYIFTATSNIVRSSDFFAFYRKDLDKFIIIPNKSKAEGNRKTFYVPKVEHKRTKSSNNYSEYLDRFDQLEIKS